MQAAHAAHAARAHLQLSEQRSQERREWRLRLLGGGHAAEDVAPLGDARVDELGQQRAEHGAARQAEHGRVQQRGLGEVEEGEQQRGEGGRAARRQPAADDAGAALGGVGEERVQHEEAARLHREAARRWRLPLVEADEQLEHALHYMDMMHYMAHHMAYFKAHYIVHDIVHDIVHGMPSMPSMLTSM